MIMALETLAPTPTSTHAIPEGWTDSLDSEWVKIWCSHGGHHKQAEHYSIEDIRKEPSVYSFTYPTWSGNDSPRP